MKATEFTSSAFASILLLRHHVRTPTGKYPTMFFSLILFSLFGSALGALVGAASFGGDGLLLGGAAGFVTGVTGWILLWIGYQRLAPAMLAHEEEYRNQPQPMRQVIRN